MNYDFTLDKYRELCQTIVESGYTVVTVRKYFEVLTPPSKLVILRHDVDRKPYHALRIAELERELGLSGTYYFRTGRHTFEPVVIRNIVQAGHEVGYHYEALARARGNCKRAIRIFEEDLDDFRELCEVHTIAMHGSPLSKYDNRDLWQKYDFKEFGIVGEVYLSIDYETVAYFTDTGRTWDSDAHNLRDRVEKSSNMLRVNTTDDLIDTIKQGSVDKCLIVVHPERWASSLPEFVMSYSFDMLANTVKFVIGRWPR